MKSDEEMEAMEIAGKICDNALEVMAKKARPGVKEYELKVAAACEIMEHGGDFNFLIVGSTPMEDPKMVFGNPRPSSRALKSGDIVLDEIAVEYRGFQVQLGTPICVGEPPSRIVEFFGEVVLPGFKEIARILKPGNTLEDVRKAAQFFRKKGTNLDR